MMTPAKVVERPGREDCIDPVELRRICELDGLMPPTQAEAAECLAAWINCEPEWAQAWLEEAEVEREEFLERLWPRLWAFGPDEQDDIGRVALEARVLSPCGIGPLVITLADGSAIVADLDSGSWHRFEAGKARRWSRMTGTLEEWRAVARRPWWRWWL